MNKKPAFPVSLIMVLLLASLGQNASAIAADLSANSGASAGGYEDHNTFMSSEKTAPMPFTGLGVKWHETEPAGTSADLFVRFKEGNIWSEWNKLSAEADTGTNVKENFIAVNETNTFQYKVFLQSFEAGVTPVIENPEFIYINAREPVGAVSEKLVASIGTVSQDLQAKSGSVVGTNIKIISRSEWGADESLRVWTADRPAAQLVKVEDDFYTKYADELKLSAKVTKNAEGQDLTWPLDYPAKVSKIIVHHTATTKNLDDPEKAIRDIYYYHTISKGWGDIGYNFIIDPKGNIYEGRYGGDSVAGAHAGRGNIGSIGIAVLGNYQENDVPTEVVNSLSSLIKVEIQKYNIDPTGHSSFRGSDLPNIMGHRDIMATTCPGDKLYALLTVIRAKVKDSFVPKVIDRRRIASASPQYDYSLANNPSISFNPGESKKLSVKIKNTGSSAWGPDTYFIVSNDQSASTLLASSAMIRSPNVSRKIVRGDVATFDLMLQAAYKGGMGSIEVFPFIDGKTKLEKYVSIPTEVEALNLDYAVTKITLDKPYLKKGETTIATVEIKNNGNVTWKRDGINKILLGTEKPQDRISRILRQPGTRLGILQEREVQPGGTGHFIVNIKAPNLEGAIKEYFAPVIEGITWLPAKDNYLEIYVYDILRLAKFTAATGDLIVLPGTTGKITVKYANRGGVAWKTDGNEPLHFDVKTEKGMVINKNAIVQPQVLPGQNADLNISFTAPKTAGVYRITITPGLGSNKLSELPDNIYVRVSRQVAAGNIVSQTGLANQNVKVALGFTGSPLISANGPFKVLDNGNQLGQFAKDEKVSVNYNQGKYTVTGGAQTYTMSNAPRFEPVGASILRIDNYVNKPAWNQTYNDNEYSGALIVQWYNNGLQVINDLPVENYLRGLAEISATDPYEKIKAVIILARTYAYFYANAAEKFPGAPYNLTDDPQRSQKYLGYGFEKRNQTGVKAVADTSGKVVTYNGKIIKTPYFTSDDGRTRSAQEVWGWTDTPWLVSVADPGCTGQTMQGHGVGLSGCGSFYLANQGKSYTDIIKYFFKGVEITDQKNL